MSALNGTSISIPKALGILGREDGRMQEPEDAEKSFGTPSSGQDMADEHINTPSRELSKVTCTRSSQTTFQHEQGRGPRGPIPS